MKNRIVILGVFCGLVLLSTRLECLFDKKKKEDIYTNQGNVMSKVDHKISEVLLNELLASEAVMLMQTLNYHWNLVGPEFHDYHLLFDKQYNVLFADMDKIAERVRAIGGIAAASMKDFLKLSPLKEDTGKLPEPKKMIVNLLKQYEGLIELLRDGIAKLEKSKDYGTRKFLEDLIEQHEKTAWMLRSLIGKQ